MWKIEKLWRKPALVGLISSGVFLVIFMGGLAGEISKPWGDHDDVVYNYFLLDHIWERVSSSNYKDFFDTRMYYPLKQTLAFGNSMLGQGIMGLPIYLVTRNTIVSANLVYLANFGLGFLAMYWLAYEITKSLWGSVLAGLVYIYNPYVWAHFPNHLDMVTLLWMPLIFLVTERYLKKRDWKWVVVLGGLFLMQLVSAFYYAFFVAVVWPIYVVLRMRLGKISVREILRPRVIAVALLVGGVALTYLRPYLGVREKFGVVRSLEFNSLLAAKVSDFMFSTRESVLYGWMVDHPWWQSLRYPYAVVHITEHSLFPGVVASALAGLGIWTAFKRKTVKSESLGVMAMIGVLVFSVLLSFGTFMEIGGLKLPGLYGFLYKLLPFVDTLRAPARFMVLGYLALGVLAAVGWKTLSKWSGKYRAVVFIAILLMMVAEYRHRLPEPYEIGKSEREFYGWLSEQEEIEVIVELPMANDLRGYPEIERAAIVDSQYLLYGLMHKANIVNGYNSYIPDEVLELGSRLALRFPVRDKLEELEVLGVDAVILHIEEYEDPRVGREVVSKFNALGYEPVYASDKVSAYLLN